MVKVHEIKQSLTHEAIDILNFWLQYQDNQFGGFYSYSDFQGEIDPNAPKGVLLHARILWAFSKGYSIFNDENYLKAANHCYKFLTELAYDKENGGCYWMLNHECKVIDSQKHVYNQGFVIYALSEFYLATNNKEALNYALKLFDLIENHAFDSVYGGYREAYDINWNPIDNKLVCDTAEGVLAEKSMNTHLHILEAYTVLYEASKNERVLKQLCALAKLMSQKIVNQDLHYGLFYSRDWQCVSHDVSFGHDIEGTWLMDKAAIQLQNADPKLANEIFEQSLKMARITQKQALDRDGAVFNELRDGHLIDCDRIWWVQAEAMVGFINAFEKSKDETFYQNALDCFAIIVTQLKDNIHGEWYWKTNRYGLPYEDKPKVEPWKCPYHNARACMEALLRLESLDKKTVLKLESSDR